jgi:hypothetical protein
MSHKPLSTLIEQIETAANDPQITVGSVLHHIGEASFAPVILLISLLMVSPLSGIPGSPTLSALLIVLVAAQALIGRRHLWLPGILLRRNIPPARLSKAVKWLRGPASWFDRHSQRRWRLLTLGPMRWATMASCGVIPMVWPFLELLPFVTSFAAGAVALLSFGLITRDGLYIILGYVVIAGLLGLALRVFGLF